MIPNPNGDNDGKKPTEQTPGRGALVSWVVDRIRHARDVRDTEYGSNWDEFTRIWRGIYSDKDKTTDSERSRLISPASQQAVEMTASEMEEATFGRTAWFDIADDIADQDKDDAIAYRDQLVEDFELNCVPEAVADTFLLGCVYGTGIAIINVEMVEEPQFTGPPKKRFRVTLEAIRPDEFFIDPAATTIDGALFCGRDMVKPKFGIKEKQAKGVYMKGPIESYGGNVAGSTTGLQKDKTTDARNDGVLITEYFGKVPAMLLPGADDDDDFGMVEAIVTLANESTVLRAVKSPYTMKDRPIIAYSHDVVPGQFWGRGVVEKGYNAQKALDAELRARIDGLALMTAPMMGADITRMPRNPDLRTRPGKFFLTRGKPSEIIEPIAFNAPGLQASFQNASDLERMVSMATGAMDTATPLGQGRRNETSGGMSQMNAAFLKRSKRTMRRVEKFMDAVVTKSLHRYMQFDSGRYPEDAKFTVNNTMGLMAREVENQQLVQMLGFVPPESPAHGIIIQALFQNTNSSDKASLKAAIDQMNQPPSEEEQQQAQQMKQMQMQAQMEELKKLTLENNKLEAEVALIAAKTEHEIVKSDLEDDLVEIQAANAATGAEKARMANNQNKVAMARLAIDAQKIESKKKQ
jgi:hypothetical protein